MSNNQIVEPNYTQIPNIIFDYWMAVLSQSEFKILMCVCRKTFGWHKTSDHISRNQLVKMTGMSANTVQTAIEKLESIGLLFKTQSQNEYGHQPNNYSLCVEKPIDSLYQQAQKDQFLGGGTSITDPGVGQKLTQGVGQKLTPQKKDYTKETIQKEEDPPTPPKGGKRASAPPPSKKKIKEAYGSEKLVKLTTLEHEKLLEIYGAKALTEMIENLDLYIASTGKRYKSHFATLKLWERRSKAPKNPKKPSAYPEHDEQIIPNNYHDYTEEYKKLEEQNNQS